MKKIVFFAIIVAGVCPHQAVAQPEIRYPNPAYLNFEQPCADIYGYGGGPFHEFFPIYRFDLINAPTFDYHNDHVCYVEPFGSTTETQTLYGVSISLGLGSGGSWWEIPFPLLDRGITLDILLYNFTPGDSTVQLAGSQTFTVKEGHPNDLYLVYKDAYELEEDLKFPMYELYFDSPIDIDGHFFIGIHSEDSFSVQCGAVPAYLDGRLCCNHGYFGHIDMERGVLIQYAAGCDIRHYWRGGFYGYGSPGVEAPNTDTILTMQNQAIFPILRPKGYLSDLSAGGQSAAAGSVRLMPNPARTNVAVEAADAISGVQVSDMMGRVLLSERYDGDARSVTLDVAGLASGSYVVRVKTRRESATRKLVVE